MKWACVGLLLVTGCGERVVIAADEIALQVSAGAAEIEFGRAIPLTVVRSWRKGLVPQEWGPQAFAPLSLRLVHAARVQNATHVQDTRRYDAFVFGRDVVQLTIPAFRARAADGSERIATGNELSLRVRTALPADDDGAIELPSDLLPEPPPSRMHWWLTLGAAVLTGGTAMVGWSRWRARAVKSPAGAIERAAGTPHERAQRRLARLRTQTPEGAAATEVYFIELAAILRDYVAERFDIKSAERTTDEILAASELLALPSHELAARALAVCDLVKFARAAPLPTERERALTAVEHFVRDTPGTRA